MGDSIYRIGDNIYRIGDKIYRKGDSIEGPAIGDNVPKDIIVAIRGLSGDLNSRPPAPNARIIALDH